MQYIVECCNVLRLSAYFHRGSSLCCSALHCVAVCYSGLICSVAASCSALQVHVCCSVFRLGAVSCVAVEQRPAPLRMCCTVLKCVAVCCSALCCSIIATRSASQIRMCCSVLQRVAARCSVFVVQYRSSPLRSVGACVLQCVAVCSVCCRVLCDNTAVSRSVLQVPFYCSVLQRVAACGIVLQSDVLQYSSLPLRVAGACVLQHVAHCCTHVTTDACTSAQ